MILKLITQKDNAARKEVKFKLMINTFEELYYKKLDPSTIQLWRKFLYRYPEEYFIKVIEIAGELKFFPKVVDIIERFEEYEQEEAVKVKKLSEPTEHRREAAKKWMEQIRIIISYGGLLRENFDYIKLGKLYEPEQLKELLNNNLRPGAEPPDQKGR
jgi:hypothetical protein